MSTIPDVFIVRDLEAAAALLDHTRLRLLRELSVPEGLSAAGLSRRVGMKRQLVNYHLRELERAGAVEVVEEKRRGSATERLVRAVARSYMIDPDVLGTLAADPARSPDRHSWAHLAAVASKTIRDVATLRAPVDGAGPPPATLSMLGHVRFASAADRTAFFEDLTNEMAKLIAEYHDEASPDGAWTTLTVGSYTTVTHDAEGRELTDQLQGGIQDERG